MGNNSIRNNLTKDYMISDLRLSLSDDIYKEKVYIIVEGEDDIKFIKSFVNKNNTILYESFDGKNGVTEIVINHFGSNKNVIGIRDKDYLEQEISPKIFFYDNCCLEMMIVENEECFCSICNEFYKGDFSSNELLNKMLKELKFLSVIRMFSERLMWAINFRALSICKIFDVNEFSIKKDYLIAELNKANNNIIDSNKVRNINNYLVEIESFQGLLEITQGHDFSSLFATICNIYANKHINLKSIESALRCSFKQAEFNKSKLHEILSLYQENIRIIFLNT